MASPKSVLPRDIYASLCKYRSVDTGVLLWIVRGSTVQPFLPELCHEWWPKGLYNPPSGRIRFTDWWHQVAVEKTVLTPQRLTVADPVMMRVFDECPEASVAWVKWKQGRAMVSYCSPPEWVAVPGGGFPNDPEQLGLATQRLEAIRDEGGRLLALVMFYPLSDEPEEQFWDPTLWLPAGELILQSVRAARSYLDTLEQAEKHTLVFASDPMNACVRTLDLIIDAHPADSLGRRNVQLPIVCLLGKTGSGKEVLARRCHQRLHRDPDAPFVAVNCAAIPRELVESTLYGHEKGAFTHAEARTKGCFEQAERGTVFLDELGKLDLDLQMKLARVLEERCFRRVGGQEIIEIDRSLILTATSLDLKLAVEREEFDEALWHRINAFVIHIPPLSERRDDLPVLFEHFYRWFLKPGWPREGPPAEALRLVETHPYRWGGNVRELRNIVDRLLVLSSPETLVQDLREWLDEQHAESTAGTSPQPAVPWPLPEGGNASSPSDLFGGLSADAMERGDLDQIAEAFRHEYEAILAEGTEVDAALFQVGEKLRNGTKPRLTPMWRHGLGGRIAAMLACCYGMSPEAAKLKCIEKLAPLGLANKTWKDPAQRAFDNAMMGYKDLRESLSAQDRVE